MLVPVITVALVLWHLYPHAPVSSRALLQKISKLWLDHACPGCSGQPLLPQDSCFNPEIQHKKAYTLYQSCWFGLIPRLPAPSLLFSIHRNHILNVAAVLWEEPGSPWCLPCSVSLLSLPCCSSEPCHRGGTAPCALHILPFSKPACYSSVGWDWRR